MLDPSPCPESGLEKLTSQIHPRVPSKKRMTAGAGNCINSPTIRTSLACPPRPSPYPLLRMAPALACDVPEPLATTVLDMLEGDRVGIQPYWFRLTGRPSLK